MEGLIPLIYRTIRRKKTRSYYRCLSAGTAQRFGTSAELEGRKLLLPTPENGKVGFGGERGKSHRRHRSLEDLSMEKFKQEKLYNYSAKSVKAGSPRIFSCIGC